MEISTLVLKELKSYAELGLNDEVHEAVITHPAYFDQAQKQETIEAAYQAGFKRVYPISEPVRFISTIIYNSLLENLKLGTRDFRETGPVLAMLK